MSDKAKTNKKPKTPTRVLLVRAMAIFLALLMILGIIAMALPMTTFAAEPQFPSDIIRVGLMYGTNITVGFETTSSYGFGMGYIDDGHNYTELYQVTDTKVSVTCDANLTKKAMTYSIGGEQNIVIGGFHVQIPVEQATFSETYNALSSLLAQYGLDSFPAYINGIFYIRVGNYINSAKAQEAASTVAQLTGVANEVVSNTKTAVSLVNPDTDRILFEFDDNNGKAFGMTARPGPDPAYIITPAKNQYSGVFEYKRYITDKVNGVAVTNVLSLEDYVAGVLPWEINRTWPVEVLKAFSVTVRTFTLSMIDRHNASYGFDLCNTTHCQAYLGCARTDENVAAAVAATKGVVLTYQGKIAKTYYSSSMGGVTVSANEAWGGSTQYPYLAAVPTPWENYNEHSNGSWTVEITPNQLYNALREAGYNSVKGNIADVKINSFAKNSSYVYSITFTDIYGNKATIERTDKIRTVLSDYLKSANFVVGKNGDTLEVTDYYYADQLPSEVQVQASVENTTQTTEAPSEEQSIQIQTEGTADSKSTNTVITADGLKSIDPGYDYFSVKSVGMYYLDTELPVTILSSDGVHEIELVPIIEDDEIELDPLPVDPPELTREIVSIKRTVKAEGAAGSFIFIGRGWGHGVGLSQWGAHDLGQLGYKWDEILNAYFTGTEFTDYKTILKHDQ